MACTGIGGFGSGAWGSEQTVHRTIPEWLILEVYSILR